MPVFVNGKKIKPVAADEIRTLRRSSKKFRAKRGQAHIAVRKRSLVLQCDAHLGVAIADGTPVEFTQMVNRVGNAVGL